LAKQAKHVLGLTGTPIVNDGVDEIYTIGKIINPEIFNNYAAFSRRFANRPRELNEFLRKTIMIRRLKKDVLKELPQKVRIPMKVEVESKGLNEVRLELVQLVVELYKKYGYINPDAPEFKAKVLPLFDRFRYEAGKAKIPAALELIRQIVVQGDKVVLFAHHREVIDATVKLLSKMGIPAVKIVGGMTDKKKYEVANAFQENDEIKVVVASIQATAEGIDLTASNYAVFLQVDWTPAKNLQAEDRLHRIGQEKPVFSYWLIAKDTLDEHVVHRLLKKIDFIDKAVDSSERGEELVESARHWKKFVAETLAELRAQGLKL